MSYKGITRGVVKYREYITRKLKCEIEMHADVVISEDAVIFIITWMVYQLSLIPPILKPSKPG